MSLEEAIPMLPATIAVDDATLESYTPPSSSSHSSSPLPTVANTITVHNVDKDVLSLSPEDINQASLKDLRSIVTHLVQSLQEARTDAANYRLQHHMLTIGSADAFERIQVEMNMAQAELAVLHSGDQVDHHNQPAPSKPEVDPSLRSVHVDLYNAMVNEIQQLKSRNMHHESTIAQQRKMIVQQESEIASMTDRVALLRERLQENRDHLNRYRGQSSVADISQYRSPTASREQRPFAALLRASDLMSRPSAAVPSTPKRKRARLPSMPITPHTVHSRMQRNIYETPTSSESAHSKKVPMSAPAPRMVPFTDRLTSTSADSRKRAHVSDATVTASDDSEAETEVPDREHIEASHASDLSRTPTRSSPRGNHHQHHHQPLTQTKLFGHVRKSGVSQREKQQSQKQQTREQQDQHEDAEPRAKRVRGDVDSIGLGIARD